MKTTTTSDRSSGESSIIQGILTAGPGLVVTIVSIILFSHLNRLSVSEQNIFSITIIGATITSLLFTTLMQLLVYRMVDEGSQFPGIAAVRGIQIGLIYCVISTIFVTAIGYFFFVKSLGFSGQDILTFSGLHFLFSGTWVMIAAFLATRHYYYPTLIFIAAYACVLGFTYVAYQSVPQNAISGYLIGISLLFVLSLVVSVMIFSWPNTSLILNKDIPKVLQLIPAIRWEIAFNISYILVIFFDKIVVWFFEGGSEGFSLFISGVYTPGAFLGLIPAFSVGTLAHFNQKTKTLVSDRYNGTLGEMTARANLYKVWYHRIFRMTLIIAFVLALLVTGGTIYFVNDTTMIVVTALVSVGSIFLSGIVFNSVVLPVFGRSKYTTLALLAIIVGEIAVIPLLHVQIWYEAVGFLAGSCVGFLISVISTRSSLKDFEFNIFRMVSADTLEKLKNRS